MKTSWVGLVYSLGDNHQVLDARNCIIILIQLVEKVAPLQGLKACMAVFVNRLKGREPNPTQKTV